MESPPGLWTSPKVNPATVSRKAQDPDQRTTYVQQWNFGIQQELVSNLVFDVAYVGNRGTKLAAFRNLNQQAVTFNAAGVPAPARRPLAAYNLSGDIQLLENLGISNYHSLQARLEKRSRMACRRWFLTLGERLLTNSVDHLSTSGAGNGVDVGVFREPQNGFDRRSGVRSGRV